jgi:hypothetical protein
VICSKLAIAYVPTGRATSFKFGPLESSRGTTRGLPLLRHTSLTRRFSAVCNAARWVRRLTSASRTTTAVSQLRWQAGSPADTTIPSPTRRAATPSDASTPDLMRKSATSLTRLHCMGRTQRSLRQSHSSVSRVPSYRRACGELVPHSEIIHSSDIPRQHRLICESRSFAVLDFSMRDRDAGQQTIAQKRESSFVVLQYCPSGWVITRFLTLPLAGSIPWLPHFANFISAINILHLFMET